MKRQQSGYYPWWTLLRDEIIANEGLIHPNLDFSYSSRDLIVNKKICKDKILIKIPCSNFITKKKALSMCPSLKYILEPTVDISPSPPSYTTSVTDLGKVL